MNKWFRYFNQNRVKIIVIIVIILFALIMIQVLNKVAFEQNQEQTKNLNKIIESHVTEGALNGSVSHEKTEDHKEIIATFIKACNTKQIEEAYLMLTEECRKALFPTKENFEERYVKPIFNQIKGVTSELWISDNGRYTYKIKLEEDILASGGYDNAKTYEDYYTLIQTEKGYQLNINKFVYQEQIGVEKEVNDVIVKVKQRQHFMDYQVYTMEFINRNTDPVELYGIANEASWAVLDENDLSYFANVNEITNSKIILSAGETKTYQVKFAKVYSKSRTIEKMILKNMVIRGEKFTIQIGL